MVHVGPHCIAAEIAVAQRQLGVESYHPMDFHSTKHGVLWRYPALAPADGENVEAVELAPMF